MLGLVMPKEMREHKRIQVRIHTRSPTSHESHAAAWTFDDLRQPAPVRDTRGSRVEMAGRYDESKLLQSPRINGELPRQTIKRVTRALDLVPM